MRFGKHRQVSQSTWNPLPRPENKVRSTAVLPLQPSATWSQPFHQAGDFVKSPPSIPIRVRLRHSPPAPTVQYSTVHKKYAVKSNVFFSGT